VRTTDGCVEIWEHKFTKTDFASEWGSVYFDKLRVDWQAGLYQLACRSLFGRCDGVMYNVHRIPQMRQKRGESPDELILRITDALTSEPEKFYARVLVRWPDERLATLESDIKETLSSILPNTPQNWPRSRRCFEFGKRCGYYPVCFEGKSLSDPTLFQLKGKRQ
jgi:hypothetical protein